MGKKRLIAMALATVVMMSVMAGCGGKTERDTENNGKSEDGQKTVAVVLKTMNNPFPITLKEGAEKAGADLGVKVVVQSPEKETDIEKQVQIVENMIMNGVDAIVLSAAGGVELIPAIKKANEANIPVLLVNDTIDFESAKEQGATYKSYIGTDNYEGALLAGKYVKDNFKDGAKVAILEGIAGIPALEERITGFKDGFKDVSNIEIVASQTANCERDQGYSVMQNMLTANNDITLVWAATEYMGLGALEAIKQMGLQDQISVICFDASDETKEAIKAGDVLGAVEQYPDEMGKVSVEKAVEVINGGSIEERIKTKVNFVTKDSLQ